MNLEDIKILREYFLANGDVIKRNMRSVIPGMFIKYMSVLQDAFLKTDDITQSVKSIDAIHLLPAIKKLQIDYYFSLASIYHGGEINQEIDTLIKNKNELFKQVLDAYENRIFQDEITQAFILNERQLSKKKLQELDKATDINPSEFQNAFKRIERDRLKEEFKNLDNNENYKLESELGLVAEATTEYISTPIASIVKFNWKKIAIAASVILFVSIATVIVINNKGSINKNKYLADNDSTKNTIPPYSAFNLKYDSLKVTVLKNESMGYDVKEEKIDIRVYNVEEKINKLKIILEFEQFQDKTGKGQGAKAKSTLQAIDSVKFLINKYTFNGETLSLYLNPATNPDIYKVDEKYYLKINTGIYQIAKSNTPTILIKTSDKLVIDRIKAIK